MRSLRALVLLLFIALLAGACGGTAVAERSVAEDFDSTDTVAPDPTLPPAPTAEPAPDPTAEPSPEPTEEPEPSGADRDALTSALIAEMETWLLASTAPGVSLSVRLPGEEPINIAAGVADIETGVAVATDDYFRIASITKTMTSAVLLTLVDEGLVDLDAPVTEYLGDEWLGEHPNAADITVAQLMNHTNGLIEFAFDIGFYVEAASRLDTPYEPEEVLEFLSRQPPLFDAGSAYQYETGGFVAIGLIIEAATGNTAAAEMRARLFEPAGAETIFLTPQEFPPTDVVHAYARGELYTALRLLVPEFDVGLTVGAEDPVLDVLAPNQAVLQSAPWTGGGNEAQMESMSAIFKAMFDGTVLSPAATKAMTETVFDSNYGLGLSVDFVADEQAFTHGGGVPGFRSQAGYLPEHDISYAFSANLIPLPDGADVDRLAEAIVPLLVEAAA